VLATVLGAVDYGYRVVIARDGLCSSSDESHDALIGLYGKRFDVQIGIADIDTVLRQWPD
jgi:nicotinamidase-related amidase